MANGTDAKRVFTATAIPQFSTGGIIGNPDTTRCRDRRERRRVRPNIPIASAATLISRIPCIDIDNLIDIFVAIPVVLREINIGIRLHHLLGSLPENFVTIVASIRCRFSVRLGFRAHLDRAINIKLKIKQPTRLLTEIISHTARTVTLVVARLIEYLVVSLARVLTIKRKIGELHQNHHLLIDSAGIPRFSRRRQHPTDSTGGRGILGEVGGAITPDNLKALRQSDIGQ